MTVGVLVGVAAASAVTGAMIAVLVMFLIRRHNNQRLVDDLRAPLKTDEIRRKRTMSLTE